MKTHVDAILIAVGTEITSGQIINRNTAWLAAPLAEAGLSPMLHWSVPDDRPLILEAITDAASRSPLIFLTGGLGPTSDDFTRLLVAEWANRQLVFSEASWERVVARVTRSNFAVADSQKQQCWFPEGADILVNPAGTADGFWLEHEGTTVVVLPGPPREVAAIWQDSLQQKLQPLMPAQTPRELFTWQCMGIPEATLAENADAALQGLGVETGYRAHFPYVEVKVWIDADTDNTAVFEALEPVVGPWTVLRHGEEAAERFLNTLAAEPLFIQDAATQGALSERLMPALRAHHPTPALCVQQYLGVLPPALPHPSSSELSLRLQEQNTHHYTLQLTDPLSGHTHTAEIIAPQRLDAPLARRYAAEKVLLDFPLWLHALRYPDSEHKETVLS